MCRRLTDSSALDIIFKNTQIIMKRFELLTWMDGELIILNCGFKEICFLLKYSPVLFKSFIIGALTGFLC